MKKIKRYLLPVLTYTFLGLIFFALTWLIFAHAYESRGYFAVGGEWLWLFGVPLIVCILSSWRQ